MDDKLATPACWIRNRILWIKSESGELRLEGGLVTFTSGARGSVFRAPLEDVRASLGRGGAAQRAGQGDQPRTGGTQLAEEDGRDRGLGGGHRQHPRHRPDHLAQHQLPRPVHRERALALILVPHACLPSAVDMPMVSTSVSKFTGGGRVTFPPPPFSPAALLSAL